MRTLTWLGLASMLALVGCTKDEDTGDTNDTTDTTDTMDTMDTMDTDDTTEMSLYDQLGGEVGLNAVLDAFLVRVAADEEINWFFMNSDLADLKGKLFDLVCSIAGGPCTYTGGTMLDVHADMAITDAQFMAMVVDMLGAMDDVGVEYSADPSDLAHPADQLLLVVGGTRADIVTDPDGTEVLFNRIGGMAAVQVVIGDFLLAVGGDATINDHFAATDLVALGTSLTLQVCNATGGYCEFNVDMKEVHTGMGITIDDFNTLAGHMQVALETNGVAASDVTIIMGVLGAMCTDIVEVGECPA